MIEGKLTIDGWSVRINASDDKIDLDTFTKNQTFYDSDHELCDPFYTTTYANSTCSLTTKAGPAPDVQPVIDKLRSFFNAQ